MRCRIKYNFKSKIMKKIIIMAAALFLSASCNSGKKSGIVTFNDDTAGKKIDVMIDGKYFTSFIYPDDLEKQVLYPIFTASGKEITRGYPRDPRPYERIDHPHHVGMWLNFGDVNGLDFWNNSYAVPAERKHRYGSIRFRGVIEQNPADGELTVKADWVNSGDSILLQEETRYIFSGDDSTRIIERTTWLTAVTEVKFRQNKEGFFGIRMDRVFEEPADKPVRYTGPDGVVMDSLTIHNEGVNGVYRNADGLSGGEVWGKRSPWVALRATKEGEVITVAIIDHKENLYYPAWSHARGYGLFAANNFGGQAVDPGADETEMILAPGAIVVFRYKVVIGGDLSDEQINRISQKF